MNLDWDGIVAAYNRDNKTDFKSRKALLSFLYKTKSSFKSGAQLYVSHKSVLKAMHEDEIQVLSKGHRFPTAMQKKLLALETKNMTTKEIHAVTGISKNYCWILLKKLDLPWKGVRMKPKTVKT